MPRVINISAHDPKAVTPWDREQVYNGLDCIVTREVFDVIYPQLDEHTGPTYDLSRSLQAPALAMRLRGVLIDVPRRAEVIDELYAQADELERALERIVFDGIGMLSFNWRSNPDLKSLFYDKLGIPPVLFRGTPTTNEAALLKMAAIYTPARVLVSFILALRGLHKKISVLRTAIDADNRIRTSYNVAGTSTGRFSSSMSEFGTGGNLQNIEESLRSMFIADEGMKFAKFDAKSGESYCVGAVEWNIFRDPTYLDACESGDVHTAAARVCWPGLPWTGSIGPDKDLAEQPFYRHHTYRFMMKKLGHGSNYGGLPPTLAQQSHLPIEIVQQFQRSYFRAFPAHPQWQDWVKTTLRRLGYLITLTGRKRWFHGRLTDPDTQREAIAYDPQGSLADIVNRAMLRIMRLGICPVVMHDHDALTFMYPENREAEIIPILQQHLIEEIPLKGGRTLRIPYDCQVGWNRGKYDEKHPDKNPDGLRDYFGEDRRTRSRRAKMSLLDRRFY